MERQSLAAAQKVHPMVRPWQEDWKKKQKAATRTCAKKKSQRKQCEVQRHRPHKQTLKTPREEMRMDEWAGETRTNR